MLAEHARHHRRRLARTLGRHVFVALAAALLGACAGDDSGRGGGDGDDAGEAATLWENAPTRVAAGSGFSCALDAVGSVYCWGNNTHGELGRASVDDVYDGPRAIGAVVGLPDGLVQLVSGDFHTCARTDAGEVWCWGGNEAGQLGSGDVSEAEPAPVKVALEGAAVDISAANRGTCAVLESGAVQCWGLDFWRILGRPSTQKGEPNPTVVPDVSDAVQVATSGRHACARQASGAVVCWGSDWWGQVGRGTISGLVAQPPAEVPGLNAVDIAVGINHGCAVSDGALQCWGDNRYGQVGNGRIGDGSQRDSETRPTLVMNPPRAPFVAVSAGGVDMLRASTCAIGDDGAGGAALYCWGADEGGEFGTRQSSPRKLALSAPTAVSVGAKHACAIADARVYCWGVNDYGQLGDGTTKRSAEPVAVVAP